MIGIFDNKCKKLCFLTIFLIWTVPANGRNIYINGIDISSARNQYIKNVNIKIDENGNILIDAPQYQVNEEETYTPLSKWAKGVQTPKHKSPVPNKEAKIKKIQEVPKAGAMQENSILPGAVLKEKAGSKTKE